MDAERWDRVQAVFHEAAARPEPDRRGFVAAACAGDDSLVSDVLAMLDADGSGTCLLDRGLPDLAGRIVGASPDFETIGPYTLERPLGEGGMGVVWLATRKDTGGYVAIKLLPHAGLSPARRERFAREIHTLAKLTHPYIARLYDAGTLADGTPWFVMEYVKGVPLSEYCRERPIEALLALFRKICKAVEYAHRQAIVHRDLKPSNILVENDGTPRLLDFGVAQELQASGEPEHTRAGLRFLSPDYAAPEWARDGTVGLYTDVYSLGVILYELLTGALPGRGDSLEKPSAVARNFSLSKTAWSDLDTLCLKALEREPHQRYQSAEALIRDLDHYTNSEPLEARPPSFTYRARKFAARRRRTLAFAALAGMLVTGLTMFFTLRLARARNAALAEAARTQRVEHFLESLFQGGDKEAGPAEDLRVVTLVDRGLQEAQTLNRDPAVQAELYETLGAIYRKLGKLDRADSVLGSALERRRFAGHASDTAGTMLNLALLRIDQARLPEAEKLARESLAIQQRELPPGHPAIAKSLATLGKVQEERGQYGKAIEVLTRAERLQTANGGVQADLADTVELLADAQFYLGHYPESVALNRRALTMLEKLHGPAHPSLAEVFVNLGNIAVNLGHYTDAEQEYRRALAIEQSWYGKDHPLTARAEGYVAHVLNWQQRYDESRKLLEHALGVTEQVYGKLHPRVALLMSNLGFVAMQTGNLDDAERYFIRMRDIYHSAYGERHQFTAQALANLGSVYQRRDEYARAESMFREALDIYKQVLPPGHVNTAIAQIKLGRVLCYQHRFREAEEQTIAGYETLQKQASPSLDYLEGARADLGKIYDALGQPEKAARFRQELAANQPGKR